MKGYILGTAGHIDHGKTALVRALTGVDTDRLKEEKSRGITIELGFAELARDGMPRFGVVDVPGHEAFVRAMLAGAAGMDVVLLVVAADEGVMPQTREHLAIVELLGVPELVVAYTKCDLVDAEWLELVEADVDELLSGTPYRQAARVPTSATSGEGLDALLERLGEAAARVPSRRDMDLARLPLDRVFTIQGTGTVVTGTLWSGALAVGDRVRILPDDLEARIRSLEVHGRPAERAVAGERTAVALTGEGADRSLVTRGATLVVGSAWSSSWMLTVRLRVLGDSEWILEHNQRVHVHHGTGQVLARCALLDDVEALGPGESGWVQLRLEEPLVTRGRDRLVLRSYSPVTTIAGGRVAESHPPKRNSVDAETARRLDLALDGPPAEALEALLDLAGWAGLEEAELIVRSGLGPEDVARGLGALEATGASRAAGRLFAPAIRREGERRVLEAVAAEHARDPLRPGIPMAAVRTAVPSWAPAGVADAIIRGLVEEGRLEAEGGEVREPGHRPELTADQERAAGRVMDVLRAGGLAAPFVSELPEELRGRDDLWSILRWLEGEGSARQVSDDLYVAADLLDAAATRVRGELAGRSGLGPADFREQLGVTRKHLLPILNFFDATGITVRLGEGRSVPDA